MRPQTSKHQSSDLLSNQSKGNTKPQIGPKRWKKNVKTSVKFNKGSGSSDKIEINVTIENHQVIHTNSIIYIGENAASGAAEQPNCARKE